MQEETFKYYAFISYSRKDSRAAAFLHRKLEKFRIPVKIVPEEARKGLGRFLRPVYRDKRDLEIGESSFTDNIKLALKTSRYLIVLCSPNSAQSIWVNQEVEYFLRTHELDFGKIVPVILSGVPDSGDAKTECLCKRLQTEQIVKRNLPTMVPDDGESERIAWGAGVVGVLSYMLKVKRADIKATVDAERIRYMKINMIIGLVFAGFFAILAAWAVKAERNATRSRILVEEKNRRLEYMESVQSSILKLNESKSREYEGHVFGQLSSTNTSSCGAVERYVRETFRDDAKHTMAGPDVIRLMLIAMGRDLRAGYNARVNRKLDVAMLLSMNSIMIGNLDLVIRQKIQSNAPEDEIRLLNKKKQHYIEQGVELARQEKKLEKEIAESVKNMLKLYAEDNEVKRKIESMIGSGDYVSAIDFIKKSTLDPVESSEYVWQIICKMPSSIDVKCFYAVNERNSLRMFIKDASDHTLLSWDIRIAWLEHVKKNYRQSAYRLEKCIVDYTNTGKFELPNMDLPYSCISNSVMNAFLNTSKDKLKPATSIETMYKYIVATMVLPTISEHVKWRGAGELVDALDGKSPLASDLLLWYVNDNQDHLQESSKFHEQMCAFVSERQDVQAIGPVRDVLSKLNADLARCRSADKER